MPPGEKITIRLPLPWYRKLKSEAALRGLTVGRLVQLAVDEWVKNHPLEGETCEAPSGSREKKAGE